jgi:hypothetical protein
MDEAVSLGNSGLDVLDFTDKTLDDVLIKSTLDFVFRFAFFMFFELFEFLLVLGLFNL